MSSSGRVVSDADSTVITCNTKLAAIIDCQCPKTMSTDNRAKVLVLFVLIVNVL